LANVRFGKPAALSPVQGLFLVALAIVTAAEGSPVRILPARDCVIRDAVI
jgi:hypothetical protein